MNVHSDVNMTFFQSLSHARAHTHSSTQIYMKKRGSSERSFFYMLKTNAGSEMRIPISLGLPSLRCKPMSSESRTPGVIPPDRSHKRHLKTVSLE